MRPESVLIFRLGSIGDTVVALPCFYAIARAYPHHRRILLTNALTSMRASSAETILDGTGLVDEVIYYPVGDFSIRRIVAMRGELRRIRPATMIYLVERTSHGSVFRDLAFFKAAGVPRIVGLPWNDRLRECAIDSATRELEHEAQRLARTLEKSFRVSLAAENWDLKLSAHETAAAVAALAPIRSTRTLIAMAPGAKMTEKDWGRDNWAALVESLATRRPDAGLVMVGARDEHALCAELMARASGPVLNLCGALTPRETAAVLRQCQLMICHDSGPMHLAASQGTRCVALFGNFNRPRKWYPFGDGHCVIHEPRGLGYITVRRVAEEVLRAIDVDRPVLLAGTGTGR
jgi:ADP-heptose:LPS heptosyltransferase